jgi:hypothetical protein
MRGFELLNTYCVKETATIMDPQIASIMLTTFTDILTAKTWITEGSVQTEWSRTIVGKGYHGGRQKII